MNASLTPCSKCSKVVFDARSHRFSLDKQVKSLPSINQSAHKGIDSVHFNLEPLLKTLNIHCHSFQCLMFFFLKFMVMMTHLLNFGKKRGRPKATQITQSNF